MYDIIVAIILGIVEGLSEFLPISSTGHLIIVNQFFNFTGGFANMFDVIIQLGAILAVIVYFRNKLFPFGSKKTAIEKKQIWMLWFKTVVGVFPALLIGAIFGKKVEESLFNPTTVAIALVIGGFVLIYIENKKRKSSINSLEDLTFKTAFLIGVIQCLSMIPGTSRSASTIIGGMLFGASRTISTEFSFFLAIPTMIAASGYSLLKGGVAMTAQQYVILGVGFITAFFVAWIVIAKFVKYVPNNSFKPFGYYRIVLGILVLGYFLIK
ncbi:undecaprenyl-diphosphate phosphatase [Paenibacillus humicus]|uniref:undecaprenyl-diphosphate phosphatase n=1 Tax=Paenibacillus humicus TaxID=412861 RepID=UPI000FD91FB4|nr:undecaprenyl-diphosphate phosphatase [Paenibacillus humicus]